MRTYIFNVTPNTAPRQTRKDTWNPRPCVLKYRAFKDALRAEVAKTDFKPDVDLLEYFHVVFVIPFPKSYSKKKRLNLLGRAHRQTPDKDNLEKGFLDALLKQDCAVYDGRVTKVWGEKGAIQVSVDFPPELVAFDIQVSE